MSVGFFFGIRHSYVPEAHERARRLFDAVNVVLGRHRLPPITDPEIDPDPRGGDAGPLGRSGLDHHSAGPLQRLGELAGESRPHLQLLRVNPYRVVYVPRQLQFPEATSHNEQIWGHTVSINVGSSTLLLAELLDLASALAIPLANRKLVDEVAEKIDNMEPLVEGETDIELIEDLRTAWLLLHEAARFSVDLDVPMTLAG